jgi:predicted RNA-binding Zn-ribbon protein involved in translation (DUF1610 family)
MGNGLCREGRRFIHQVIERKTAGMVRWEDISQYLRIPCPHCGHESVILEYIGDDPEAVEMVGPHMFQCPRCEVCMDFEECERFRREANS